MLDDPAEALRQSGDLFRKVVEHAPEGIFIQREGRFTYLNPAALRLYGAASAEQLLGQPVAERIHPVCRDSATERIRLAGELEERAPASEEKHLKLDGTVFDVEVSAAPVVYEDSAGAVVFIRDVTGYKLAEAAQRLNRALLRSVIEATEDAVYAKDHGGRFVLVNSAACRMVGKQPEEILGRDDTALFAPDAALAGMENDQALLTTREKGTHREELTLASGERITVQTTEGLVLDQDGHAFGLFGIAEDITGRQRSEEEGAKLREQLLHAQKLESIGSLAGGVAHDFNNMVTVINGYCDLLLDQLTPNDPMHEDVTEIRNAGERATGLCHQLLVLGRKQIPRPRGLNLNDLIADAEKLLVRVIGEDIRLETVLRPSLGQVHADPGLLQQVLMDLTLNARDAMPGGGTLLLETEDVDLADAHAEQHPKAMPCPYVQLKVSDTGIGMTKDVMARLFEPFFTTKTPGEGKGLGLATVYGIVKQSGGSIWADSEPGEGTTFKICLPRVAGEVTEREAPRSDPAALRGTETILVVEDQEELRKLARAILRRYGYIVIEAGNGGEALLHAERYAGPIHLMLSEIAMPGMAGRELADRVKSMRPEMEVLFMSGYGERDIVDRRIPGVGVSFLSKPFSPDALAGKVREVLGATRPAGTILVVDDEPGTRRLLRKILAGAGYQVEEAADGKDALKRLDTTEVDLMITDLVMPEQDGLETIRILHKKMPRLKIIAISGKFDAGFLRAAEFLGAHASLAKPIGRDALLDTVRRVMVDMRAAPRGSVPED